MVLLTGDHLRWDHIRANGNEFIHTPAMDRIAREGVSMTGLHTVGVACSPNRGSLFTGRYPSVHGMLRNGIKMPESEYTLTNLLRDNGYYTGQMGKLHFWPHANRNHREYHPPYGFHQMRLSDEPGCYEDDFGRWLLAQGPEVRRKANVMMPGERGNFNYYVFEGDEKTTHAHWVASESITFIEQAVKERAGQPFFLNAGFYHPHPPLNPPQSMLDLYKGKPLPKRRWDKGEVLSAPPVVAKALARLADTPENTWDEYRRFFYAMVSELDRNVGRILDSLDRLGVADNTIVVMSSDHGDYLGDHNLVSKSALPYDGSMRIPWLMRGPGVPKGAKSAGLCEMVDVMPTLLDVMGMKAPKGTQGRSMKAAMSGGAGREYVFQEGVENRILKSKRAKYCFYASGQEVLFDLERDPDELRNVAGDSAARALRDEMRVALLKKSLEARDPLPEPVAPY